MYSGGTREVNVSAPHGDKGGQLKVARCPPLLLSALGFVAKEKWHPGTY